MASARTLAAVLLAAVTAGATVSADEPLAAGVDGVPVPKKTKHVQPVYPAEALAQGIRGIVILDLVVNASGKVGSTSIIRSVPGLDEAAIAAASQWEYEPVKVDGKPVAVRLTVPITFALALPKLARDTGIPELRQGTSPAWPAGAADGGTVTADVTLDPDGRVGSASITAGDEPWASALLTALKTWRFPAPEDDAVVSFRVSADFVGRGGDRRVDLRASGLRRAELLAAAQPGAGGPAGPATTPLPPSSPAGAPAETPKTAPSMPATDPPPPDRAPVTAAGAPPPPVPPPDAAPLPPQRPSPPDSQPSPATPPPGAPAAPGSAPDAAPPPTTPPVTAAPPGRAPTAGTAGAPAKPLPPPDAPPGTTSGGERSTAPPPAPPVEVITAPAPALPPENGVSAIRDVTLQPGVPDLARGRRPVPPPLARLNGTTGTVEVAFSVSAAGATTIQTVNGPEALRRAALEAVGSWVFRRTRADRAYLVALFNYGEDKATAEIRPQPAPAGGDTPGGPAASGPLSPPAAAPPPSSPVPPPSSAAPPGQKP